MPRLFSSLLAAGAISLAAFAPAAAAGNPEAGKKVFVKCAVCHGIGEKKGAVGPSLNNVIGRKAGTQADFAKKYSKQMIAAGAAGLVWDEAQIAAYVADPKKKIPGNKMAFAGLKNPKEIEDVVAYIKTYSGK